MWTNCWGEAGSAVRSAGVGDHYRAAGALDEGMAGGAEQETAESAAAPAAHDHELSGFRPFEQMLAW